MIAIFAIASPITANQQWCGIQTLYFQHNASTSPVGYEELINYPSGNGEVDEPVTITNADGWKYIDSYITPENSLSDVTSIDAGLRRYRYYTYVSLASGTTQLNFTPFLRLSDGTEKYFYSAVSDDINDLAVTEYLTSHVAQTSLTVGNKTDRIVIKVYAKTTHSSPVTIHWIYQGATHTSHVESGNFECDGGITPSSGGGYGGAQEVPIPILVVVAALAVAVVTVHKFRR